jgi:ribosome biogenesis GTPase
MLVVNNAELLLGGEFADIRSWLDVYARLGYQVLELSASSGAGLGELQAALKDHISVFVGQSGVGKSSLINALLPGIDLRVGALSDASGQGTPTTTPANLFHFPEGGDLIDSPGIREFGLTHISHEDLLEGFVEFSPFLGFCKFRHCAHLHEPG